MPTPSRHPQHAEDPRSRRRRSALSSGRPRPASGWLKTLNQYQRTKDRGHPTAAPLCVRSSGQIRAINAQTRAILTGTPGHSGQGVNVAELMPPHPTSPTFSAAGFTPTADHTRGAPVTSTAGSRTWPSSSRGPASYSGRPARRNKSWNLGSGRTSSKNGSTRMKSGRSERSWKAFSSHSNARPRSSSAR
jgi:hypothetical protein